MNRRKRLLTAEGKSGGAFVPPVVEHGEPDQAEGLDQHWARVKASSPGPARPQSLAVSPGAGTLTCSMPRSRRAWPRGSA